MTYASEPLTSRRASDARDLVLPNLLMYFPCARLPLFRAGTVEPPTHVVSWREELSPLRYPVTSPFIGVLDLYDLERLPTSDSDAPPADVYVYEVDTSIPGTARLAPEATTVTS